MQDNIDLKIQIVDLKSTFVKVPTLDMNTKIISIYSNQNEIIKPNNRKTITTGIRVRVPKGYILMLMNNNVISSNNGIITYNQQIDPTNQEEIKPTLYNSSTGSYIIKRGDIICSALLIKMHCQTLRIVKNIDYNEE